MISAVLEEHRKQCEMEGKYVGKSTIYYMSIVFIVLNRGWDGKEQNRRVKSIGIPEKTWRVDLELDKWAWGSRTGTHHGVLGIQ